MINKTILNGVVLYYSMRNFLRIISVVGDYALLSVSLLIVILVRTDSNNFHTIILEYTKIFSWLFLVWLFLFYLFDLYNFDVPPRFSRFFFCVIFCALGTTVLFYFFPTASNISPKTNLVLLVVIFSVFYYFWRQMIELIFINVFHGHEIMLAVSDNDSFELACILYKNPRHKYHVNGILVTSDFENRAQEYFPSDMIYTDAIHFEEALIKGRVSTLVSTSVWFSRLYGTMYDLLPRKVRIINMINFYEKLMGYIPVLSTSQHWIMTNVDLVYRRIYMVIKLFFDVVFAIIMVPIIIPILFCVIIGLKLFGEKHSNPFFTQKRVGLNNKEFTLLKFRTMYSNAERHGAQWAIKNDPRITSIGKILRLTRLDELPQIFNILKGDMSFIGPRPERKEFVETLAEKVPHYHLRHLIKPGLSGWAQVKFRYGNTIEDSTTKLCYDLYYIKNMNIVLDFRIVIRTIIKVVSAAGQ